MRQFGLSKFQFTDISDKDLDVEVEKIDLEFPYCGENFIKEIFSKKALRCRE